MASVLEPRTDVRLVSRGDEPLYEVVDGQRVDLPSMSILSNIVANCLNVLLYVHAKQHRLGTVIVETLLILLEERDLRRRPDVAFVSAERWPLDRDIPETGDWAVIPDLAVEVISPNDRYGDVIAKVYEYFDHGVREVWVVEPEHRVVNVYSTPTDVDIRTHEQTLQTPLLPGLTIALRDVFVRRPAAAKELRAERRESREQRSAGLIAAAFSSAAASGRPNSRPSRDSRAHQQRWPRDSGVSLGHLYRSRSLRDHQ